MSPTGSPSRPIYKKFKQDKNSATKMYGITVDEGWRSWILCADMYEWAADQLVERLTAYPQEWKQT